MRKIILALFIFISARVVAVETIPFEIVNNSKFADGEVYIALVGRKDGAAVWYDFANSTKDNPVTKPINTSFNTVHKASDDWGYADIFTSLDKVKSGNTVYMPKLSACRIFYAFKSPMYIHFFDDGGYAGADLQNPSDPNYGVRWELIEFTWADNGLWVNTSRVDAFQYPMGVELWGAAGANVAYAKAGELISYSEIIAKWKSQLGNDADFAPCYREVISTDNLGGIIEQPTKLPSFKEGGASADYYKDYIDKIWNYYSSCQLVCDQGERGVWRGEISGGVLTMTGELGAFNGVTARISAKPTTQEIIEGKGVMAEGNENDKALQAQFCGAIARGAIDLTVASGEKQNWGDASKYYKNNTYNKYAAFFHQTDVSFKSKTYAFSYDDTFDQSSTLVTSKPAKVKVTVGGFTQKPSDAAEDTSNSDNPSNPEQQPTEPYGSGTTDKGLKYEYSFSDAEGSLTVTFTCTNSSEYVGMVPALYCYSRTGGDDYETIGNPGAIITKKFSVTEGETLSFRGKWMFAGGEDFSDLVEYKVSASTSVVESDALKFSVYPNPATDILYIDGGAEAYVLTDLAGRVIKSGKGDSVDVSNLHRGRYIISVDRKSLMFIKR